MEPKLISVFPIPSVGTITMDNLTGETLEIELYSDKGQLINSRHVHENESVKITNLGPGIYFYSARGKKQGDYGKIIVVKRN